MNCEDLLKKLQFLRRPESEHYNKASVAEGIDVLIECCEFLMNEHISQLDDEWDCE